MPCFSLKFHDVGNWHAAEKGVPLIPVHLATVVASSIYAGSGSAALTNPLQIRLLLSGPFVSYFLAFRAQNCG